MTKTITIEQVQAQTIRQTVAREAHDDLILRRLDYVFPIASGVPYWRVIVDSDISDHLDLAAAVAAYNAG